MNACELTASITALANALACNLTEDELNLLGAALTQLGDTLITIATQKSICSRGRQSPAPRSEKASIKTTAMSLVLTSAHGGDPFA